MHVFGLVHLRGSPLSTEVPPSVACDGWGTKVVGMEDFSACPAWYPLNRVLELVRDCDAYVGLVAWRYGYIPANPGAAALPRGATAGKTSITEYEYLAAKEKGIPVLAFVLAESVPWPPPQIDGFGGRGSSEPILAYRAQLMRDHVVSFFSTPEALETASRQRLPTRASQGRWLLIS